MGPYVTMVVAIFLIVFTGMTIQSQSKPFPLTSSPDTQASSSAQVAPVTGICRAPEASEVISFQAPSDKATKCPGGPGGQYKSGGDFPNKFKENTTYKLIRKNVPLNKEFFTKSDGSEHSTKATDAGITTSLDPSKYELYFPQISGEVRIGGTSPYSRTRDCAERSYEFQGMVYFIDYGLAFGLVLQDGKPVEVGRYYLTDVFKDINRAEVPKEAFDLCSSGIDAAPAASSNPKLQVMIPQQQESTNSDQLQLGYFLFSNGTPASSSASAGGVVNGWVDTCKPAIYLYPPQKQLVNVKVAPQGFLTYTDPLYDLKNGWTVEAYPDGKIYDSRFTIYDKPFNYLYYESKIRDEVIQKPTKGWVVQSSVVSHQSSDGTNYDVALWFDPLKTKFETLLPQLGLNTAQTKDFIDYWKKALPYSPYYFIGIVDQENIDQFEALQINPKPDSINRVRIYFERLDKPKQVEAPVLSVVSPQSSAEDRRQMTDDQLFRVVEWGGMVKNDINHPFTCSQ